VRRVARLAHLRWYADGWTVVRAGTPGDAFYTILDGHAQVQTSAGHTRMLETDAFFGELALLDGAPRTATVTSDGGLTVARIARPDFARLLREEPSIGLGLARGLVAVVRDIEARRAVESTGRGRPDVERVGGGQPGDVVVGSQEDEAALSASTALGRLPLIARIPLFEALNKRHLRRVIRLAEPRHFKAGEAVVRAGARGDAFYVILAGAARVETPDGHGRALGPGGFFGELALLDGGPRSATVTATGELTTLRIGQSAFAKLLREEPTMAVGLAKGLAAIVRGLQPAEASKGSPSPPRSG
jgi:CRP-like cAMP-binding protein